MEGDQCESVAGISSEKNLSGAGKVMSMAVKGGGATAASTQHASAGISLKLELNNQRIKKYFIDTRSVSIG